jgi:hypothetical protein
MVVFPRHGLFVGESTLAEARHTQMESRAWIMLHEAKGITIPLYEAKGIVPSLDKQLPYIA